MPWYVYWLSEKKTNKTYIGKTNDLDRRLSQHNGEKSGGARATHGGEWTRVCHIAGFPDERAALQFEWAWKFWARRQKGMKGANKRFWSLLALLNCDKVVSQAEFHPTCLQVIWEDEKTSPFTFIGR